MTYEELHNVWMDYIDVCKRGEILAQKRNQILSGFTSAAEIAKSNPAYFATLFWFMVCVDSNYIPVRVTKLDNMVCIRLDASTALYVTKDGVEYHNELLEYPITDHVEIIARLKVGAASRSENSGYIESIIGQLREWVKELESNV